MTSIFNIFYSLFVPLTMEPRLIRSIIKYRAIFSNLWERQTRMSTIHFIRKDQIKVMSWLIFNFPSQGGSNVYPTRMQFFLKAENLHGHLQTKLRHLYSFRLRCAILASTRCASESWLYKRMPKYTNSCTQQSHRSEGSHVLKLKLVLGLQRHIHKILVQTFFLKSCKGQTG